MFPTVLLVTPLHRKFYLDLHKLKKKKERKKLNLIRKQGEGEKIFSTYLDP